MCKHIIAYDDGDYHSRMLLLGSCVKTRKKNKRINRKNQIHILKQQLLFQVIKACEGGIEFFLARAFHRRISFNTWAS